jgi:hypothetical protein
VSQDSPVALANRRVPFATACRWADVDVPGDVPEHGIKVYCPFGDYAHEDGGAEMAFRVYPDHGYCFACGEWFTPVKLCAVVWDCTQEEAARQMLEQAGVADPDYREQWKRLTDWSQPPDVDSLVKALRAWCAGNCPKWSVRQYDEAVAGKLADCLRLLSLVRTEKDCRAWLAGCKKAMASVLDKGERHAGRG